MQKVNWGIIGLGSIAKEFADGFSNLKNAKLLGIASRDKNKIEIFKEKFRLQNQFCFNNYDKLIENKEIDIIYLALPTFLHKQWIINCFNKNKKILVEKPVVMNSNEILEIEKYFHNQQFFFEAFMYLFHPQIKKTFDLIEQDEIGEIISMESFFGNNILTKKNWFGFTKKKKINPKKRIFNKEMGGGSILDLGCYPVFFSKRIASLKKGININNIEYLNKKITLGPTGVEVDAHLTLNFDNDFKSKIGASFNQNLGKKSEIIGSKGKIVIMDTWTANVSKVILNRKGKEIEFNIKSHKNIYSHEIESISDLILNGSTYENRLSQLDQSKINMQILDVWKN